MAAVQPLPTPAPRTIQRLKVRDAVNFNRTENGTLDIIRDKCVLLQTALGVEVSAGEGNRNAEQSILIPWPNIGYVKYA